MDSKNMEKFSERKIMSALVEAFGIAWCLKVVQPSGLGGKNYLPRIAREIDATTRRAKAFVYAEAKRIDADELENLRAAGLRHANEFERHAARLEACDPQFHRTEIDRLRHEANRLRNLAS